MKTILITAAFALVLSTSFASAQSSEGKGSPAATGESANTKAATPGGSGMMTKKMKKLKKKM